MKKNNIYGQTVVRLWSDNYEGDLVTWPAYCELRLQMSTGDYCTHRIEVVTVLPETLVYDLIDVTDGVALFA